MSNTLRVLQLNAGKRKEPLHSLFNDPALQNHSIFFITEPPCFRTRDNKIITTPARHQHWSPISPTVTREGNRPYRAMLWVRTAVQATTISTKSPDLAAAVLHLPERTILALSIYIPVRSGRSEIDAENLNNSLQWVEDTINFTKQTHGHDIDILLAGDFNRHDAAWGGNQVALTPRQGEAEALLQFAHLHHLTNLLPRGTITWSQEGRGGTVSQSTIDLIWVTEGLASDYTKCAILEDAHATDHEVIETSFLIHAPPTVHTAKRLYKNADWAEIRRRIREARRTESDLSGEQDLNALLDKILRLTEGALQPLVPVSRPSPYSRPWWTPELTQLREIHKEARKELRRSIRQQGYNPTTHQHATTVIATYRERNAQTKTAYFNAMRTAKGAHWTNFLDDTHNIWKAAKYIDPEKKGGFSRIPPILHDGVTRTSNKEIGELLLRQFFPPLPPIEDPATNDNRPRPQIYMQPLTMADVQTAVFSASPHKAPGKDNLPAMVWQQLWPALDDLIFQLFRLSIDQGKLPDQWKIAKIIPLRKPKRGDYTIAKHYRPISLLSALGKMLELVVANRISYLAEEYHLLPDNHFGARKQRNTEHALQTLVERIHQAWRRKNVLSLVSFDVQGAYNGVAKEVLIQRLRKRRIPEPLVRWTEDFCSSRKASITINGVDSAVKQIPQAGLPQGSPLSPILYLFFNADLVERKVDTKGGASAFVDDYNVWVTGPSADENTTLIQDTIVPQALSWAAKSGATFEADKTEFIHFSRIPGRLSNRPLQVGDKQREPSQSIKVLGVVLDQKLNFHEHIAKAADRGVKAVEALRRIRGLRPKTIRQLVASTVLPVVDYASIVWATKLTDKDIKLLQRPQRLAAQAVTGSFRTVALPVAEVEASMADIHSRYATRRLNNWIKSHTLPESHPFWAVKKIIKKAIRYCSPLKRTAIEFDKVDVLRCETIKPFCVPPWRGGLVQTYIDEREQAIRAAEDPTPQIVAFTDGSGKKALIGAAMVIQQGTRGPVVDSASSTIGTHFDVNIYYAELAAIDMAVSRIIHLQRQNPWTPNTTTTIFTDSQSAIKSLRRPYHQSGQFLIARIIKSIDTISATFGNKIAIRWVPSHEGVKGNERAHALVKSTTKEGAVPELPPHRLYSSVWRWAKTMVHSNPTYNTSTTGRFTRELDQALPGNHTRILYNSLSFADAQMLAQLRSGRCRLNYYLNKINATDSPNCNQCNEPETVEHFLIKCPNWAAERSPLVEAAGYDFHLHYILGGWKPTLDRQGNFKYGPKEKWKPNMKVVAAAIAFAKATDHISYKPSLQPLQHEPHTREL